MVLSYLIIEVLKRHSSEKKQHDTHPLNQKEIFHFLQEDYTDIGGDFNDKRTSDEYDIRSAQERAG